MNSQDCETETWESQAHAVTKFHTLVLSSNVSDTSLVLEPSDVDYITLEYTASVKKGIARMFNYFELPAGDVHETWNLDLSTLPLDSVWVQPPTAPPTMPPTTAPPTAPPTEAVTTPPTLTSSNDNGQSGSSANSEDTLVCCTFEIQHI